jgi:hypothetical protein
MPKKQFKELTSPKQGNVIQLPLSGKRKYVNSPDMPQMVSEIQKKVNGSAALNGGFDALMYKVDKIEETQGKIVETVGSIHNAIYHPDDGIFARINSVKVSQGEDKSQIEKQLIEINSWKNRSEKSESDNKTEDKEIKKKIEEQKDSIQTLERWKSNVNSLGKWTLAAVAGGVITIAFRALYELVITK